MILQIKDLKLSYGAVEVLKGISLDVKKGELVTVIGANGAGKTSLLKCISGIVPSQSGDIQFEGRSIRQMQPHQVAISGVAHCPEGRKVFSTVSVEDNLVIGGYALARRKGRKAIDQELEKIYQYFPRLKDKRDHSAASLSGGEQQLLAIARALMMQPHLLILDEPTMGLAPKFIDEVLKLVESLKVSQGMTLLLVEQMAYRALAIADRGYVLEQGQIRLSGTGKELLGNDEVRKAYLGG